MRRLLMWILVLGMLAPMALAAEDGSGGAPKSGAKASSANPASNSGTNSAGAGNAAAAPAAAPAKPAPTLEDQLQELRDLVTSQSKELAETREQMKQQQEKMESLENQLKTAGLPNAVPATPAVSAVAAPVAAAVAPPAAVAVAPAISEAAKPAEASSSSVAIEASTSEASSSETSSSAAPVAAAAPAPAAAPPVAAAQPVAAAGQGGEESESPLALRYKGITITPGGFLAAEFVRRSRALAADVNTPFNSVTMPGASQSGISEFFGSGRQSRISMLAEGKLSIVKLSGYYESDFLSSAATSNNNQSNSYSLRQRQVWGQAAFESGWSFTGGQMWSLITETKHGMDNRTEALPMTIDAQYHVGFSWARQYGLRLVKNFDNKVWLGVSMENAQATLSSHSNASNFLVGSAGASGGLYNPTITTCSTAVNSAGAPVTTCTPTAPYSFNPSPDVVAKLAFEPGFGHYEVFGVYSRFQDRIFPCAEASATFPCDGSTKPVTTGAFNNSNNGGGFGANARWSFAKKVDFGLHAFTGRGIGRYGSGGLADASVHADGALDLVRNYQGLATIEFHFPKVDVYFNAGEEYAKRASDFDPISGKAVGYGATAFNNSGCFSETLPANGTGFLPGSLSNCTADTRFLAEGTAGFWWKLYDGSLEKVNRGRVQFGPQFSYVDRQSWSGTGGLAPHGLDAMVFTSFRYYLP